MIDQQFAPTRSSHLFGLRQACTRASTCVCSLAVLLFLSTAQAGTFALSDEVEEVLQFSLAPAALTASPSGEWLVALDQKEKPSLRAVRILKSGEVIPFPDRAMSTAAAEARLPLDALEAVSVSQEGIVWMLDNGRRSETTPKLVGWNIEKDRLHRIIPLNAPAVIPSSFCTDLALDPTAPVAYIADPAKGQDAALIVADLNTGLCRRLFQGSPCVRPDPSVTLPVSALSERTTRRIDGTTIVTQCGVDALAIDRRGEWLYFAGLQSRTLYRLPAPLLRNLETPEADLLKAVENYATKPATISMAIDSKGNLYLGESANRAIGIIDAKERTYRPFVSDVRLLWPDNLTFGHDGRLYFSSPNKATPKPSDQALSSVKVTYSLFRTRTPASGRAGD